MALKWRARLTLAGCAAALLAAGLVLGPGGIDRSPWYAALALIPLAIVLGAQLFAFRCPHCGARAVRGRHGYFLVSDTCDQCLRDFEGPNLSEAELGEKLLAEDKPELARQLRQERLEEQDLRNRAPGDPQAAAMLQRILKDRIDGVEFWVRDVRRLYEGGEAQKEDVEEAEASLRQLHNDLEWCGALALRSGERRRLTSA